MSADLSPICGFDIRADGAAVAINDTDAVPAAGHEFRWIHVDLTDPGLAGWCATHLPALPARTLMAARTRPRVDHHDDGLIITLRGINLNSGAEVEDMVSLRIWMTDRLVVSVRKMRVFAMDDLRRQMHDGDAPPTPARMIARITENLVERIETVSLDLEDRADTMENNGYEKDVQDIPNLAPLRRSIITLRRHIGPMSDALGDLARIDSPLIPKSLRSRMRDTANRAKRSVDEVNEVADRLDALSDHLDLEQATRLARNSYILSVIAAIFLPLGFLTGLFGVNVGGMPGIASEHAFYVLSGAMALLGVLAYIILRWIKWF